MTTTITDDVLYIPWLYKGIPFDEKLIGKNAGFVYCITDLTTGKRYIGRKYFVHSRKKKGKRVKFDSDWKDYYGSSETVNKLVEVHGRENFKREIVCLGKTRGEVNFGEVLAQVLVGVLESEDWLNESINKWKKTNVKRYTSLSEIREHFT
jgi:hypothetical protein